MIIRKVKLTDLKSSQAVCLGDSHLSIPESVHDDFRCSGINKVSWLLDILRTKTVIYNGDLCNGKRTNPKEIFAKNPHITKAIWKAINEGRLFINKGNHDGKLPFPWADITVMGNFVFLHGHIHDLFNNDTKLGFVGKIAIGVLSVFEKIGFRNFEYILKALQWGRDTTNEKYYLKVVKFVDRHPEFQDKVIVENHTHHLQETPIRLSNCWYLNSGTCSGDRRHILNINLEEMPRGKVG